MQGRVFSLKLSPNLRMRTKKEENALQEDNLKLFNNLNLYKIQKVLSNIVKLPDFVNVPKTMHSLNVFNRKQRCHARRPPHAGVPHSVNHK